MAIAADAQQLQADIAHRADIGVVLLAEGLGILGQAVGHPGVLRGDVHMVEQIALHEIAVALVMRGGQPHILVQVDRQNVLKADKALLIPVYQITVGALGGGAGSQTQHASGVVDNFAGNDLGGAAAHGLVVFFPIDSHDT